MAENGEKRDPSSHRTPTQIKRQVRGYNHRPENIKKRVQRDKARRKLMKEGKVKKGDGKDVHHVKPVRSGGTNSRSNLRVVDRSKNRRGSGGKNQHTRR
jgi:hypothetical protein